LYGRILRREVDRLFEDFDRGFWRAPSHSLFDLEPFRRCSAMAPPSITGLWRDTSETALFVSDVVLPAAQCAKAIRDHWHIENRSHYVRDGSFAEDASRIRRNPGIFARLRSFAANILRFNGIHNVSDGRHRIAFGGINAILGMRIMY
jgi:predicted transposase YbfD/YdcC